MAVVPVPRSELIATSRAPAADVSGAARRIEAAVPAGVLRLLERLWGHGHAAYVVGGSLRDALMGRDAADWDLATSARPDQVQALFPDARYENRFGTVGVPDDTGCDHEITTFRDEHDYADFRRPHRVEFGNSIERDLGRRDFTVNALAWGRDADEPGPHLIDPFGGLGDIVERRLRTVGEPAARFGEDALRMLRAVRLAAALGFDIEPATLDAIRHAAPLAVHLSGERIAAELLRLLRAPRPSVGLRLAGDSGLLRAVLPELAAQRGIGQNKVAGEDLWHHTLRTVDAAPPGDAIRLAALLHDVGKPSTAADGHFHGHDAVGAAMAEALLRRLHLPRPLIDAVAHLVRLHMFGYERSWSDAAVRRFVAKVGPDDVHDLLALRRADNVGSGLPPNAGRLDELAERVDRVLTEPLVLDRHALAVNGRDLMDEAGYRPGRVLGRVIDRLVERVVEDPSLNDRATLLRLARAMRANAERVDAERHASRPGDRPAIARRPDRDAVT
ncbi:MAG TPA: HD domain-containing protein [Candidatus Limnocylindrales bacterium]|nr:HD domain-containing protein [Candidatus Limnocylindrales bacterium]